jgi:uncharacterized membrane protein
MLYYCINYPSVAYNAYLALPLHNTATNTSAYAFSYMRLLWGKLTYLG